MDKLDLVDPRLPGTDDAPAGTITPEAPLLTFEQIIGAALTLLFLIDIFLTVLYARAGTGLLAPYWNRGVWAALRAIAMASGRDRGTVLTFAGPLIVVSLIGFWAFGLAVGAALVIQPELGVGVRSSDGQASTDFVTALLVAGNSLSIVGGGSTYAPQTTGTRLIFLTNSLIGASVLSLLLSYLVQVYSGLRERNSLALTIDLMSEGSGNAAKLLARLMPGGDPGHAASQLGSLLPSLAAIKEAHHFYPLLFYFRFEDPRYAVSRLAFVLLDLTTLIQAALDTKLYGTLAASGSVTSLRYGTVLLLQTLDRNFPSCDTSEADESARSRDRETYAAAAAILAEAGISLRPDGFERYVAERRAWEPLVRRIAPMLGYATEDIDRRRP